MSRPLTRVLVFSSLVTLTTALGNLDWAGHVLAIEPDADPTKIAMQANNDFAFDLYQQLAKENAGENLFFSPYSVFGALAMTAEGAQLETAAEMGNVLRFPEVAKRGGGEAQRIPWETSLIHTGVAELNKRLMGGDEDPVETAAIRRQIEQLRTQLVAARAKTQQHEKNGNRQEQFAAQQRESEIANNIAKLSALVDQYEIRVANALWGEKTYPFDPAYVKTINEHYKIGGMYPVDFRNAFEEARLTINSWVEKQTNDRIHDLIADGLLDAQTRLVLTNAIYFKGDWSMPFEETQTENRDFTRADGTTLPTPIMHAPELQLARYGAFNADGSGFDTPMLIGFNQDPKQLYPKADGFAIVELPYKGGDLSMVVIAPNAADGLAVIEEQLTPKNLDTWIGHLKNRTTDIYLPKFKLEAKYTLGGTLQAIGMVRAFNDPRFPETGAQFYGMTTSTDPNEQLYISKVLHKAFIEVNEKGTEAAAATAVLMFATASVSPDLPFTPEFKADRPFLYLIRDVRSGSVLFLGRMTSPPSE